jgi:hypothetical protein
MDSTRERPAWTRPGFVLAAALMVLVVLAAVLLAVFHDRGGDNGSAGGTAPGVPGSTAAAGPEPTAVPTTAPAGVTWRLVGQVAVPFSTSAGPRTVTATTASGYAHTPVGALIAAAQLSTRSGLDTGRASYDPTIEHQFVPSPDRAALLAALHAAPQVSVDPGELSQIAGFQYVAYSPDTAVVSLVNRSGASNFYATTLTLQWRGGDWMMVAPPGGTWLSLDRQVTDLTGVVTWGAQ